MKKSALAVVLSIVIAGAIVGGLFGSRAQAKVDRYTEFLRRYTNVLRLVEEEYVTDIDPKELVHASIRGMLRTLDPHSNFLPKQEYTQLQERQQGSYHGLGISVQMRDGDLTVISPFEGTPAYRLGIRSGDVISKIEGEETRGMELDDAVKRLRGPKGSEVTISVTRAGYDLPLDFTIVRDKIDLRSVPYAFMISNDTGYLRISDFTETTEDELHENLVELQKEGAENLILDLRDNPGGLLDQAVAVSNKFLKKGSLIVYTRGRTDGSDYDYLANRASSHESMPIVVLVSHGSASASEIVSGAIQDHDRGLIVGESTFGKGLVQSIYRISEGNGLALTTAQYFTPSGRSIQRDYSGSIDDYYYNARIEDRPDASGEVKYTDAGRKVFGGGGITPDIVVTYPKIPSSILALNTKNVFFKYATRFAAVDDHRSVDGAGVQPEEIRTARPKNIRLIDERFRVDDEVLQDFFEFLDGEGVAYSREELLAERDALSLRIEVDIFGALWGAESAQRAAVQYDPQITAALQAMPKAKSLLTDPVAFTKEQTEEAVPDSSGQRALKQPQP
ncbi:MAG TPA: S41 family peptidase [Vicinamibacteria bacterium]|nr:S41 family peptidase [Vicinamibacteria bacterium]